MPHLRLSFGHVIVFILQPDALYVKDFFLLYDNSDYHDTHNDRLCCHCRNCSPDNTKLRKHPHSKNQHRIQNHICGQADKIRYKRCL